MTFRASMMIFLVAAVGAECARPVRTGPLIQRYSAAACVPVQRYFDVTPPSVHNMILTLERRGLIKRTPGRSRSVEVVVPLSEIPLLD